MKPGAQYFSLHHLPARTPRTGKAAAIQEELAQELTDHGAAAEHANVVSASILLSIDLHVERLRSPARGIVEELVMPVSVDLNTRQELRRIAALAAEMNAALGALSQEAHGLMRSAASFRAMPRATGGIFGALGRAPHPLDGALDLYNRLGAISRDLRLLSALAHQAEPFEAQPRRGRLATGASFIMSQMAKQWRDAAGAWPSGAIDSSGKATAILHQLVSAYFDAIGATAGERRGFGSRSFQDAVGDARAFYDGGVKGLLALGSMGARQETRRGRRRKSSATNGGKGSK